MDLMESFRILRRHWIMTSALLVLTLAGTAAAAIKLPWTYQSTATMVLLNSKSGSATTGNNPYLAFDNSLSQAAEVVSLEVTDPRTAQVLQAHGYPNTYQVGISSVTGGPVLETTVTGSNKSTVEHTLYGVMQAINTKLHDLQTGITPRNLITAEIVSVAPHASRSVSKKAKPLVVVLFLGLVLTFAIPQIVDGMTAGKRSRREVAAPPQMKGYLDDRAAFERSGDVTRSHSVHSSMRTGSLRAYGSRGGIRSGRADPPV
jgi:hypothetical protein